LVSVFTFYNHENAETLKRERRDVAAIASLIANQTSVYVEFSADAVSMSSNTGLTNLINSFDSTDHIIQVKVFRFDTRTQKHDIRPLAEFLRANSEANLYMPFNVPRDTIIETDNAIVVHKSIRSSSNPAQSIGSIVLVTSLEFYLEQKNRIWFLAVIMVFTAIVLSTLFVLALQSSITKPILKLSDKVYEISKSKNYGIENLYLRTHDEISQLSFAFGKMLNKIESDNHRLVLAKEEALESVKAKDEFLAKMSHEIRTPLNAIIGLSNLLNQSPLTEDQAFYLNNIRSSSNNLLAIINEILDFSKIQAGKLTIEHIDFDFHDFLTNFRSSARFSTDTKDLTLVWLVPNNLPNWIKGDPVRLNQVLLNLLSNAIKFTEEGEITVKIQEIERSPKNIKLRFSIQDTGIGIPELKLKDIFESFNQASNATTRKYGGTGLGLTISRQLVELQHGQIWVESTEGVGSHFYFDMHFPITKPLEANVGVKMSQETITERLMELKIQALLVEDNKMNRLLARKILENCGIHVIEAESGRTAIHLLRHENIDLILMDLHMPDMDGYSTTQYIRANFEIPKKDTPIIALTAAATKGEVEKCFQIGMNEFVSKPIDTRILLEKIYLLFQ
jgi:signal transduction histidine kinase/CheY-like chemotaxis protein